MTLKEVYEHVNGDYEMLILSLGSEDIAKRLLLKYLNDKNYEKFIEAVKNDDLKAAFEAAHTLKGTTGMFYFSDMNETLTKLVEQLRSQTEMPDKELIEELKSEQEKLIYALNNL